MSTPYDAQPRESDTLAVHILRKRLSLLQAAYDELLGDVLGAKRAYFAQRDGLREEMRQLTEAIELLEREEGTD